MGRLSFLRECGLQRSLRPSLSQHFLLCLTMPSLRTLSLALFCVSLLSLSASARAEDVPDTDAEARALYEAGRIAFDQGRFEAALRYFQGSYRLSGRPALLFNIGTVADRLRQDEVALDAFRRYLAAVPDSPERPGVLARIRILEEAVARSREAAEQGKEREKEAQEPVSDQEAVELELLGPIEEIGFDDEPSEPHTVSGDLLVDDPGVRSSKSSGKRTAGFILLGVGGAALATGAILVAVGQNKRSDIENALPGTYYRDLASAHHADGFTGGGVGALLVGAGVITGGILMIATSRSKADARPVEVSFGPLGFELRGEF